MEKRKQQQHSWENFFRKEKGKIYYGLKISNHSMDVSNKSFPDNDDKQAILKCKAYFQAKYPFIISKRIQEAIHLNRIPGKVFKIISRLITNNLYIRFKLNCRVYYKICTFKV